MTNLQKLHRGRGALSNPAGRFEPCRVVPEETCGIGSLLEEEPPPRTIVTAEKSRTIISRNDSPDVPFDQSINPYKGCEHGCVYCFARPTHAYLGLSPGLDFETRIFSKPEAPSLLRQELRHPGYRCQPLALGANTDPYQPVERDLRITRRILEVLAEHHHPVSIVTKSDLVLRDLDILEPMARRRLACVLVSVTTLDRELARRMEPRAATPTRRIETLRRLSTAGVPTGVLASPMILGLNDGGLERILEVSAAAGARTAGTILLRLPHEIKDLFSEWLRAHYPLKASRVLHLVRETRGGGCTTAPSEPVCEAPARTRICCAGASRWPAAATACVRGRSRSMWSNSATPPRWVSNSVCSIESRAGAIHRAHIEKGGSRGAGTARGARSKIGRGGHTGMCGSEARKGWIELVEDSDPVRAELVRGRLESEGMGVVLETVPLSMMPMPTGRSTRYRLWVRVADEAEARRLLKEKVPASELEKAARESALESPDPKPKTWLSRNWTPRRRR